MMGPSEIDRAAWLEQRRTGIGGSDVAAVLGLSAFRTPTDVYLDKIGEGKPQEVSESMHFGTILEDVVADEFARRTGMKVQRVNTMLRETFMHRLTKLPGWKNLTSSWAIANIDRAVINPEIAKTVRVTKPESKWYGRGLMLTTDTILECKTANAFAAAEWGESQEDEIRHGKVVSEHKIPIYYETQIQWYMGVTGAKTCYVAVLIGGSDFRIYKVDRDDDLIQALIEKCAAFWLNHVMAKVPPAPVCVQDVTKLHPEDDGDLIEADNAVATDIGELRTITERINDLKRQSEALKTRITEALGDRSGFTIGGEKAVTFKEKKTTRLDSSALKRDMPEVVLAHQVTTSTRVFKLY